MNMVSEQDGLHFSLGPVQGFIAQARRTRDLWMGSYLLSYLSGTAMRACGGIEYPDVDQDPLYLALTQNSTLDKRNPAARVGSLVNRWHAQPGDPAGAAGKAQKAVREAWGRIHGETLHWLKSRSGGAITDATERLWKGQVEDLWEIQWVVGDSQALDRRKNLRPFRPHDQAGEKCTICGERSALHGGDSRSEGVREFWTALGANLRKASHFAVANDGSERLCAVCTVKRMLPLVRPFPLGWELEWNYPSTASLSSALWRKTVLERAAEDPGLCRLLEKLSARLNEVEASRQEGASSYQPWSGALTALEPPAGPGFAALGDFAAVDGEYFYPEALAAARDLPPKAEAARVEISRMVAEICQRVRLAPKPFYAILAMDGDGLGKALSEAAGGKITGLTPAAIARAVSKFAGMVREVVEDPARAGRVVYCGGDDVLALLPVETALPCAEVLRHRFQRCVADLPGARLTISAAVVYAHMSTPLRRVVEDAHRLLDDVAKEELGRNAFAVRVWKRGGPALTWGKPWQRAANWADAVTEIAGQIRTDEAGDAEPGVYSNRLLFRLRELIDLLQEGGRTGAVPEETQDALFLAEHTSTRGRQPQSAAEREQASLEASRLRALCAEEWNGDPPPPEIPALRYEGVLFARFLAQKEI